MLYRFHLYKSRKQAKQIYVVSSQASGSRGGGAGTVGLEGVWG